MAHPSRGRPKRKVLAHKASRMPGRGAAGPAAGCPHPGHGRLYGPEPIAQKPKAEATRTVRARTSVYQLYLQKDGATRREQSARTQHIARPSWPAQQEHPAAQQCSSAARIKGSVRQPWAGLCAACAQAAGSCIVWPSSGLRPAPLEPGGGVRPGHEAQQEVVVVGLLSLWARQLRQPHRLLVPAVGRGAEGEAS